MGPDTDEEKEYAEYLASLPDDVLEKQLSEEASEFDRHRRELADEHLEGDDKKDLERELGRAEELASQTKLVLNMKGAKENAAMMERLQEVGEQNEVFLEDLKRDAYRDSKKPVHKWKEGQRPAIMEKLVHQMDTRAEVLRHRSEKKRLEEESQALNVPDSLAQLTHDEPFAKQVSLSVGELQSEMSREERLMDQGDEGLALKQATALEEYARAVQEQVQELERNLAANPDMPPDEKKEHEKVLSLLEKELVSIEGTAADIERAYERRQMRLDTVDLTK